MSFCLQVAGSKLLLVFYFAGNFQKFVMIFWNKFVMLILLLIIMKDLISLLVISLLVRVSWIWSIGNNSMIGVLSRPIIMEQKKKIELTMVNQLLLSTNWEISKFQSGCLLGHQICWQIQQTSNGCGRIFLLMQKNIWRRILQDM